MSPFDRAHITSYLRSIANRPISYRFQDRRRFQSFKAAREEVVLRSWLLIQIGTEPSIIGMSSLPFCYWWDSLGSYAPISPVIYSLANRFLIAFKKNDASFQIVDIRDLGTMDSLLKHTPHAVVHPVEVRRVRRPERGWDKIWRLLLQQHYCVLGTMWWGTVLLKDEQLASRCRTMSGSRIRLKKMR